jgi:hypothetical protein
MLNLVKQNCIVIHLKASKIYFEIASIYYFCILSLKIVWPSSFGYGFRAETIMDRIAHYGMS